MPSLASRRISPLTRRMIAAVAVSAVIALSGCTGGSVTGNEGGGDDGRIAVSVWYNVTGPAAESATRLIDEFNASQSTYAVSAQYAAPSDKFDSKLINALKNGTGPSMVLGDSTPQQIGQVVETGKVLELDSLLADPASTITKEDFTEGLLATGVFDGTQYTLPTDAGDYAVVYNKQMFEEAGITRTPTTWAEFAADAEKLTQGTTRYGVYLPIGTGEWPVFTWQSMLWGAGGEFLNADNTEPAFNSPEGVAALTAWTDLIENGSAYPQSLQTPSEATGAAAMTSKKVAMQINGAYNLPLLDEGLGAENVGVFPLPGLRQPAMNLGTNNSYILKTTDEQQAGSWAFLQYWLSPSTQAVWCSETGILPTNKDTADDPTWTSFLEANPRIAAFAEQLSYARARPSITQYGEVSTALSEALQKAMLLQVSPSEALAEAEKSVQAALEK